MLRFAGQLLIALPLLLCARGAIDWPASCTNGAYA
jgi:hypothetical protein